MSNSGNFKDTIKKRNMLGMIWEFLFLFGIVFSMISLISLIFSILNNTFGFVAYQTEISTDLIEKEIGKKYSDFTKIDYDNIFNKYLTKERMKYYKRLSKTMSLDDSEKYLFDNVIKPKIIDTIGLWSSVTNSEAFIEKYKDKPNVKVEFRRWINVNFLISSQSSNPLLYGLRTAIFGSLWIVFLTILISVPIGVGTAIYLEHYSNKKLFLSKLIQINIYNLSGVPSIVYGLFGLILFVVLLQKFSSGQIFGLSSTSSRTILAASLTMSLLILPIIIITSQQAIQSVPKPIIDASYGLGATKYQTIFSHILPNCIDKILTGIILALSRAIGESSPLIVVGASTFITVDPKDIFSRFTVIPIQIYQLTTRPQHEYAFLASSAIIVLLVILISLNMTAILMRNKIEKKYIN